MLGLSADDVGVISKHDSSTQANDLNEARLHERLMDKLGRSKNKALPVISQKALTGHPKGAAAAWQMNGLMQVMASGVIPGNASLDNIDSEMRAFSRLVWNDVPMQVPVASLKAGIVTTLGFGHVSALVCLAHPFLFWRMLSDGLRSEYAEKLCRRQLRGEQQLQSACCVVARRCSLRACKDRFLGDPRRRPVRRSRSKLAHRFTGTRHVDGDALIAGLGLDLVDVKTFRELCQPPAGRAQPVRRGDVQCRRASLL